MAMIYFANQTVLSLNYDIAEITVLQVADPGIDRSGAPIFSRIYGSLLTTTGKVSLLYTLEGSLENFEM